MPYIFTIFISLIKQIFVLQGKQCRFFRTSRNLRAESESRISDVCWKNQIAYPIAKINFIKFRKKLRNFSSIISLVKKKVPQLLPKIYQQVIYVFKSELLYWISVRYILKYKYKYNISCVSCICTFLVKNREKCYDNDIDYPDERSDYFLTWWNKFIIS